MPAKQEIAGFVLDVDIVRRYLSEDTAPDVWRIMVNASIRISNMTPNCTRRMWLVRPTKLSNVPSLDAVCYLLERLDNSSLWIVLIPNTVMWKATCVSLPESSTLLRELEAWSHTIASTESSAN